MEWAVTVIGSQGQNAVLADKELQLPANLMHQDPSFHRHELRLKANKLPHFLTFYDLQRGAGELFYPGSPRGSFR